MTTTRFARTLPEHADLDHLRGQARELQRGVRAGVGDELARCGLDQPDPRFPLSRAQFVLAREYGFPSWPRLHRQVTAVLARTWDLQPAAEDEPIGHRLLRFGCLNNGAVPVRLQAAEALLVEHPEVVGDAGVAVAAVCGRPDLLAESLHRDPSAASVPTGPYGWTPLFYLAYSRIATTRQDTEACARLLLEAGADADDGRFFGGFATPFTVLTGSFGGGEGDQPPHPHAMALGRLLLEAGADPNDAQTLYNRQFRADDDFLDLLLSFGLGRDQGGPWARLLPDAIESPAELVRGLLAWAVVHDQRERVARLGRAGVDLVSPLTSWYAAGRTPLEAALLSGHRTLAEQLRAAGADEPRFGAVDAVVAAVLAGDRERLRALGEKALAGAKRARPGLVVWAASQGGLDAVRLAFEAGFGIDALARADVFLEQPWQTALHTAVEHDSAELVQLLLELGADTTIQDARFGSTPAQWAEHLGHPDLLELFP